MTRGTMKLSLLLVVFLSAAQVAAAYDAPQTYEIPRSFEFSKNFYTVFGSPDIQATIVGSNEFERGRTVTLYIDMVNRGKLLGFDNNVVPSGADDIFAAQTEMKLESRVIDATGIVAQLSAEPGSPVEVKSTSQLAGSIRSGQNAQMPLRFDIKIDKKAPAGEYPLYLNLTYDYQKNVQISNANAYAQTYEPSYWYGTISQNQTLRIKVKKQADFEIIGVSNSMLAGRSKVIEITIKNTGEDEAKNVKAIISPSDPISTTDDKAYLNAIGPGKTATARYRIKAESSAVPKSYAIDVTIRYENPQGDILYSSTLQAPVEVTEPGWFDKLFGWL